MERSDAYCLVLGGGGAKGVYHIGVRRALRELDVPIGAYIGNSIGAIMAAFLAQGLDERLEEIADSITVDNIVCLPEEMKEGGSIKIGAESVKGFGTLYKSVASKGGLDTTPMRRLLEECIDEAALRAGSKDLGVMTVNLSDLRPREVFLDDMEEGSLIDYLMASSALPGFTMPEIRGKKYVDGGVVDNLPYEMARKRGYRRIIVVDVSGAGINPRPRTEGSDTVFIKNSIDMGSVLDFDREFLHDFEELGYLDAMRAFGTIGGYACFIRPDEDLEREFRAFIAGGASRAVTGVPERQGPADPGALGPNGPFGPDGAYRAVFPQRMRHDRRVLMKLLDCAASILELPRVRAWDYAELAAAIAARASEEEERLGLVLGGVAGTDVERKKDGLERLFAEAIKTRKLDSCPYYYYRLVRAVASKRSLPVLDRILVGIHPELPAGMLYFEEAARFMDDRRAHPTRQSHRPRRRA
jgi:NTE family protein